MQIVSTNSNTSFTKQTKLEMLKKFFDFTPGAEQSVEGHMNRQNFFIGNQSYLTRHL